MQVHTDCNSVLEARRCPCPLPTAASQAVFNVHFETFEILYSAANVLDINFNLISIT